MALGWLQDQRALPRLMRILIEEPELKWTTEALLRLGALDKGLIYGTDVAKGSPALVSGFGKCVEQKRVVGDKFMGRCREVAAAEPQVERYCRCLWAKGLRNVTSLMTSDAARGASERCRKDSRGPR